MKKTVHILISLIVVVMDGMALSESEAVTIFRLCMDGNSRACKELTHHCMVDEHGYSCDLIGVVYEKGLETDIARAKMYYLKSCELDNAQGCTKAGTLYLRTQNYDAAIYLLEKACRLESERGCLLAELSYRERRCPGDEEKSLQCRERAYALDVWADN
jgi:TPR repeat protein